MHYAKDVQGLKVTTVGNSLATVQDLKTSKEFYPYTYSSRCVNFQPGVYSFWFCFSPQYPTPKTAQGIIGVACKSYLCLTRASKEAADSY